jgi:hypothetical protein
MLDEAEAAVEAISSPAAKDISGVTGRISGLHAAHQQPNGE